MWRGSGASAVRRESDLFARVPGVGARGRRARGRASAITHPCLLLSSLSSLFHLGTAVQVHTVRSVLYRYRYRTVLRTGMYHTTYGTFGTVILYMYTGMTPSEMCIDPLVLDKYIYIGDPLGGLWYRINLYTHFPKGIKIRETTVYSNYTLQTYTR